MLMARTIIYMAGSKGLELGVGVFSMHLRDIVLLCVMLAGLILFLYGANYCDALSGWIGVCLVAGGFLAEVLLRVFKRARKKGDGLEAVKLGELSIQVV